MLKLFIIDKRIQVCVTKKKGLRIKDSSRDLIDLSLHTFRMCFDGFMFSVCPLNDLEEVVYDGYPITPTPVSKRFLKSYHVAKFKDLDVSTIILLVKKTFTYLKLDDYCVLSYKILTSNKENIKDRVQYIKRIRQLQTPVLLDESIAVSGIDAPHLSGRTLWVDGHVAKIITLKERLALLARFINIEELNARYSKVPDLN